VPKSGLAEEQPRRPNISAWSKNPQPFFSEKVKKSLKRHKKKRKKKLFCQKPSEWEAV